LPARIGIVGGGFSGLLSAYLLERLGSGQLEIVLFEEAARIGGRVRSGRLPHGGGGYEAGVAEFYDIAGNAQLRNLIDHLGLETRPLSGTPYFSVDDQVLADERALTRWLGRRSMERLRWFWDQGTRLRSPAQYAMAGREQDNAHPWLRRSFEDVLSEIDDAPAEWFTAMQCHSDLATEPAHTNGLFGMDNLLIDHPGYCSMYTLTDGNEGLIRALAERVNARVYHDTPVKAVHAHETRGLVVEVARDAVRERFEVDALIVTLPPSGLQAIQWYDEELSGTVAGHVRHHDHGTSYLRVTLLFRQRFWRDVFPEDYFVSDAFGGVTVYDQSPDDGSAGCGVQSWLLAGADAAEQMLRPDQEVIAAVMGAMPAAIRAPANALLHGRVDRWTGVAGVSALPGGVPLRPLTERHSPDARWPQLQFVGDYLYDSTVCGALDAVLYSVFAVADHLGVPAGNGATGFADLVRAPASSAVARAPSGAMAPFFLDPHAVPR